MVATPKIVPAAGADALPLRWQKVWRWSFPILTLAAVAGLAWQCFFDSKIHFLDPGPGPWIVYPLPAQLETYAGIRLEGTFRRSFVLTQKPAAARLVWRCLTNGEVFINGAIVPLPASYFDNWKITREADVSSLLRPGTNEISVVAVNQSGPPAISLSLEVDGVSLASDSSWDTSIAGSDWRKAEPAATIPPPEQGNELYLLDDAEGAFSRSRGWLFLFAAIGIGGAVLLRFFPKAALAGLAAAWLVLLLHNIPLVPAALGFDAPDHLEYIKYIQQNHHLPKATDGFEMYHPPLYYILSARLLDLGGWKAFDPSGMMVLRFFNLAIGLGTLLLVFAGLRLIFPGHPRMAWAGATLAAFLPAQLCLLHYTTNETLSALFITASICIGLLVLRHERPEPRWCALLGLTLGLALLTKSSAILVAPLILGALAFQLCLRRERNVGVWLTTIGAPILLSLALSGWHYWKLWRDFGSPLIASWDVKISKPWWLMRGFQTPDALFSFGQSLRHPYYSGLHSIWDGFYSTLWGDGLLGGRINLQSRPPWNYDCMTVGFLLALIPAIVVLTGLVRSLARSFRAANLPWILLIGLGWTFAFALLSLNLKLPYYGHSKAFFALPVLLAFCAFAALGFDYWFSRGPVARFCLSAVLGFWLVNTYASFWIRPKTEANELSHAIAATTYAKQDPAAEFGGVLRDYPNNSPAIVALAAAQARSDAPAAVARLDELLKNDPANDAAEIELGWDLGLSGRPKEGIERLRHAAALAPQSKLAAQTWLALAVNQDDYPEVITAARHALRLDPTDPQTRFGFGVALMNSGRQPEAARHFSALVDYDPAWSEARFCLGLCLMAKPGKRADALAAMKQAVQESPTNQVWQGLLKKAEDFR